MAIGGLIASGATAIGSEAAKKGGTGGSGTGQILANIGNRNVKNKTARGFINATLDPGGGLTNTLAALGFNVFGDSDEREDIMSEYEKALLAQEYKSNENFLEMQEYLKNYGINLLEGNPNDYYKPIGEIGGSQFENYLQAMKGDVMTSALETSAAAGRAGGRAVDIAAQTTGKISSEARYADYLRALEGRKFLMGQGRGMATDVMSGGQKEGQLNNAYNLDRAGLDFDMFQYMTEQEQEKSLLSGENLGTLVNMGIQGYQGYQSGGGWSGVLQAILGGSPQKGEAKISTKNDNKRLSNVNTTSPYEVYPDSVRT